MRPHRALTLIVVTALGAAPAAAQVTFRGLLHTPLGNAQLLVLPDDALQVLNLSVPGDGVHINLTGAQFATAAFADLSAAAAAGATLRCDLGGGNDTLATVQFFDAGALWEVAVTYPQLGTLHEAEVWHGDQLLDSDVGLSTLIAQLDASRWNLTYARERNGRLETTFEFDPPAPVRLVSSPNPVSATRLVVRSTLPGALPPVDRVFVSGTSVPPFRLVDETLGMFSFRHRAIGPATLEASGVCPDCTLHVQNANFGGGVMVDLVKSDGFYQKWQPISAAQPTGATLAITAFGTVDAAPDAEIGRIQFTDAGAALAVTSSLAGVGATMRTVEVRDDGVLVHRLADQSGALVATAPDGAWPIGVSSHTRAEPDLLPGFNAFWADDVPFRLAGGPMVSGDQLVVIASDPAEIPQNLTHQQGGGIGDTIPDIDIADGQCDVQCLGDIDGSNDIDIGDLDVLLANFGTLGVTINEGDLNDDGANDIGDLAILLALFQTPCGECE